MSFQTFPAKKIYSTFLSIPLSDDVKAYIEKVQKRLKKIADKNVEWESVEKLHCTLLYLGKITNQQQQLVGNVTYQMAGGVEAFPVSIGHIDYFFKRHQAGILYLSIYDQQQLLVDMHRFLVRELNTQGFSLSYKKLVPHISIARIKKVHGNDRRALLDELAQVELSEYPLMHVDRVQMLQSQYQHNLDTTDYKVLKEYRFIPTNQM